MNMRFSRFSTMFVCYLLVNDDSTAYTGMALVVRMLLNDCTRLDNRLANWSPTLEHNKHNTRTKRHTSSKKVPYGKRQNVITIIPIRWLVRIQCIAIGRIHSSMVAETSIAVPTTWLTRQVHWICCEICSKSQFTHDSRNMLKLYQSIPKWTVGARGGAALMQNLRKAVVSIPQRNYVEGMICNICRVD